MKMFISGLLVAAVGMFLSGCVVMPEGVGFVMPSGADEWSKGKTQLTENRNEALASGVNMGADSPGVIAIGRVGPYRDLSDGRSFEKAYERYSKVMTNSGEIDNIVPPAEFKSRVAGWTTVTTFSSPLLGFQLTRAYVPPGQEDEVDFSSVAGTVLVGARGGLVAAVFTVDFPFFFVRALLCEDGDNYSQCADAYKWGLYDITSGKEVSTSFKIKDNGNIIDTSTFRVVGR